jgi:hypothetical protein
VSELVGWFLKSQAQDGFGCWVACSHAGGLVAGLSDCCFGSRAIRLGEPALPCSRICFL